MLQTERVGSNDGRVADVDGSIANMLKNMDKGLKIWHAVMATVIFICTIAGFFFQLSSKVNNHDYRIERLEDNAKTDALLRRAAEQKQSEQNDKIMDKLNNIELQLKDKENRK